jgi:deazaflavin-dependent oxidoreductase (nitroreductase family)
MPLSPRVARFNKRVTNRLTGLFATRAPGFAIIDHVGRKSGRTYATPINAFRTPTGYRVALTYGPGADWTRNVLAAGTCTLHTRGRRVACRDARLGTDPANRWAPPLVRAILARVGVADYLDLTCDEAR